VFDAIDIDDLSSGRFRTMTRKELNLNQGIPVPGPFHPAIPTEGNLMETSRRSRHLTAKIGWDDTGWVGLAVEVASSITYWCLAGNGWEWGNGIMVDSYCGSFPHSLLSTSKIKMGSKGQMIH